MTLADIQSKLLAAQHYQGDIAVQTLITEALDAIDELARAPQPQPVGLFSLKRRGSRMCFHQGATNPNDLCRTLDKNVTGGPHRALIAYAAAATKKD